MKTIVWDVDDVLNDLMRDWFAGAWLPTHQECKIIYEDIQQNPPHDVLGISREEYLKSLDAFRAAEGSKLLPVPEVYEWFQRYGHLFRHAALTAVPLRAADISAAWVMKHFGRWIRSFNVVPSPRPDDVHPRSTQTKKEFLACWGPAHILIDDSLANVEGAQQLGMRGVLFPRPWNRSQTNRSETLEQLNAGKN